jgi:uncharacterized protein YbjT (DUF2867 family)
VAADIMNADHVSTAFQGADAVYAMPSLTHAEETIAESRAAARILVNPLVRANVGRVVALSSGGAHLCNGTGAIHTRHDFEEALATLDAHLTLIRAADFMENWPPVLPLARSEGVLPTGRALLDGPMETVSIRDIGALAANCLIDPVAAGTGRDYARCLPEVYSGLNAGTIGFESNVGETRRGSTTVLQAVHVMLKRQGWIPIS